MSERKERRVKFHKFRFHLLIDRKQQNGHDLEENQIIHKAPFSVIISDVFFVIYSVCFSPNFFFKKSSSHFCFAHGKKNNKNWLWKSSSCSWVWIRLYGKMRFFCFDQQLTCWEIKKTTRRHLAGYKRRISPSSPRHSPRFCNDANVN